tara:strand:- start:1609 stop:3261 length:1653 start_codon:yes stop_codon:yes gene_type:complete
MHLGTTQDIKVQRGYVDAFSDDETLIDAVNSLSSSFALLNNNRMQSGGPDENAISNIQNTIMGGAIELTSLDKITHRRIVGTARHEYEIWEYKGRLGGPNEFIVRDRFVAEINFNNEIIDTSISGIQNINNCVCFVTGITSTLNGNQSFALTAIAKMTDAGNCRVTSKTISGGTTRVYVSIVEFTGSAWAVSFGEITSGFDSGLIDLYNEPTMTGGLSSVSWDNSFIYGLCSAGNTIDVAIADHWPTLLPNDQSTVKFTYVPEHDGDHDYFVYVVQNNNMNVSRFTDRQSHTGSVSVDIASANLTILESSACFVSRITTGGGTAYGRGWVNAGLITLDVLYIYCHRFGNSITTELQIVDMANLFTELFVTSDGSFSLPVITSLGNSSVTLPQPLTTASFSISPLNISSINTVTFPQPSTVGNVILPSLLTESLASVSLPQIFSAGLFTLPAFLLDGDLLALLPQPLIGGNIFLPNVSVNALSNVTLPQPDIEGLFELKFNLFGQVFSTGLQISIEDKSNELQSFLSENIAQVKQSSNVTQLNLSTNFIYK